MFENFTFIYCVLQYAAVHVWRSEDNSQGSILSFYHVGPTQAIRTAGVLLNTGVKKLLGEPDMMAYSRNPST